MTISEEKYREIKKIVTTGCVIAFSNKFKPLKPMTWLSTFIRYVCKKPNHIGVIVKNTDDICIYESIAKGFKRITLYEKITKLNKRDAFFIFQPEYPNFSEEQFLSDIRKIENTPYDVPGLLTQLGLHVANIYIGKRGKDAAKQFYCYESMFYLHRNCPGFENWWECMPKEFYQNNYFELIY